MAKVYDTAIFVSEYLMWKRVNCNNGPKMKNIEEIHKDIYQLVKK